MRPLRGGSRIPLADASPTRRRTTIEMVTQLDYQSPSTPGAATPRAPFCRAFVLAGIVGAPFGDWVWESWHHVQRPDGGGFILACAGLGVAAAFLFAGGAIVGPRMRSVVIAAGCGLRGPLLFLLLLDFFVF